MPPCLDENELHSFFDGRLSRSRMVLLQRHLDQCSTCRQLVAALAKSPGVDGHGAAAERVVIRAGKVTRRPSRPPGAGSPRAAPVAMPRWARAVLHPGTILEGRWRLERILGEGGTAEVWEATSITTPRRVALKILKLENENATRRFLREARVTAALRHPNIVDVQEVFVLSGTDQPAMVMEYLDGMSLGRVLRLSEGPLSVDVTARVLLPITSALRAAHAAGVVHRDLKPDNVFLVGAPPSMVEPHVKVLDFGLAKLTAREGAFASTAQLTRTGYVLGTPHYMAPEQVGERPQIDVRTDVWALGSIAYECLAGRRAVEGRSISEVLRAIVQAPIAPLDQLAPWAPRPVTMLVGRMLSRSQADRPTLLEVHETLSAWA